MSKTSKEMSTCVNSDAIDAVTEGINKVCILNSEVQICANCGKESTDVTNTCNKCKVVKYCNAACKKKHRHKHKKACERRVAELNDEKLFKQPPPMEDCPICMQPMPFNPGICDVSTVYMPCCGKTICDGCSKAEDEEMKKGNIYCWLALRSCNSHVQNMVPQFSYNKKG